jgi:LysR family glycine cleavage system transcriptional activator
MFKGRKSNVRNAMPARLPPLNALRAFEAAARHLSISRAAAELHVTPAAVSHQIRGLEQSLGIKLFRRLARGLEPTEAAQACLGKLRAGFAAMTEAVDLVRAHTQIQSITVGAAPSFADKWLVPRIQGFVSAYPDIDLRVEAGVDFIDDRQDGARRGFDGADIAIRFGTGHYPGCRADKLFPVAAAPMCSPRLLQGEHPLRTPADLSYYTLLHDDTIRAEHGGASWKMWLDAAGVEGVDVARGPHFNHASLGLDAAIDGMGVVLGYPVLASADLAAGRLVMPFDFSVPLGYAYYLVCADAVAGQPAIAAFREWITAEARAV